MRARIILLLTLFSTHSFADELNLKLRIYSADWCAPCQAMHKALHDAGIDQKISVKLDGQDYSVPIEYRDVSDEDNTVARQGKLTDSFPEIQLLIIEKNAEKNAGVKAEALLSETQLTEFIAQSFASYKLLSQNDPFKDIKPGPIFAAKRLKPAAAVLIGTGRNARQNPVFVGMSLRAISETLRTKFNYTEDQYVTLYGAGDKLNSTPDADAIMQNNKRSTIAVENVNADLSFTRQNLRETFSALNGSKNTLMIFSGHGHPGGVNMWNEVSDLSPQELKTLIDSSKANTVIVSGNCHGGQFAFATSCGFFAARPDTIAEGCSSEFSQLNSNHLPTDYSNVFFRGLKDNSADLDGNGEITFEEAHWYATISGGKADTTYTTLDALADQYFTKHPDTLPDHISKDQAIDLASRLGTIGEKKAMAELIDPEAHTPKPLYSKHPFTEIYLKDTTIPFEWQTSSGIKLRGQYKINVFGAENSRLLFEILLDDDSKNGVISLLSLPSGQNISKITMVLLTDLDSAAQVFFNLTELDNHGWPKSGYVTIPKSLLKVDLPKELYGYQWRYLYQDLLNYRPALVQLIRRLIFKEQNLDPQTKASFDAIYRCEQQSVNQFLNP